MRRHPRAFALCVSAHLHAYSLTVPILPIACSISLNDLRGEGTSALAAILKETQIQELECAAAPERSLLCQCPLTRSLSHHLCSALCSLGYNEIGAEGASALAAVLKETQITTLG